MINFKKIKEQFIQRKFDEKLSDFLKDKVASSTKIRSVGILTTDEVSSKIDLQKKIEEGLNIRNSKIYSFRKFDKINEASFKHFSEKDINWKGHILDASFQSFLNQPFDLLINMYNKNNLYLEFATLHSAASFKVGFSNVNEALFDLEIAEQIENLDSFTSEVKKYLQILQKIEN